MGINNTEKPRERHGNRFRAILLLSVLFCGLTLVKAPNTQGETLSLGIYPPLLEVMIKPGKTITQVFNLTNFGDPIVLTTQILPFTPKDELGNIYLQPETEIQSPVINWFSLLNSDLSLGDPFLLESGQNQQIVLKLKVPQDAREDDYYLSLVFISSTTREKILGTQSKVKLAANILLTVSQSGKIKKSAKIVDLKVPKIVDSFDKIPISLRLKNTGPTFFKPHGQITLKGLFNLKSKFPLLPENVLANSTRILRASSSALPTTDYRLPTTLALSGFFLGPYKVLAEIVSLDDFPVSLKQEVSFLALPFKLTFALFLMALFLILIKERLKREKEEREQKA